MAKETVNPVRDGIEEQASGGMSVQPTGNVAGLESESLQKLAGLGAVVDGGGEPGAPATAALPAASEAATVADVVDLLIMAREMAAPALEHAKVMQPGQLATIWSDATLERVAKPLVAIMERHGLGLTEAFDKFGPYVMLVASVAGPAFATYKAIKENAIALANEKQQ